MTSCPYVLKSYNVNKCWCYRCCWVQISDRMSGERIASSLPWTSPSIAWLLKSYIIKVSTIRMISIGQVSLMYLSAHVQLAPYPLSRRPVDHHPVQVDRVWLLETIHSLQLLPHHHLSATSVPSTRPSADQPTTAIRISEVLIRSGEQPHVQYVSMLLESLNNIIQY